MEVRYHELERARNIFERYVQCLPTVKAWVRFAKFEMQNGEIPLARACYERAVEQLGEDAQTVQFRRRWGFRVLRGMHTVVWSSWAKAPGW